jgi:hypothetical protein
VSSDTEAPTGEAKAPPKGARRWSLTTILAVATSAIALAAGGLGLLFKIDPAAEPCIGGASGSFVDVPVFPESRGEYGYVASQTGFKGPSLGAEVRATTEVDNLRGHQVALYYTLLKAGVRGGADRVVSGADEFLARAQVVSSCAWRGGFDVFVEPTNQTTGVAIGLDPKKSYRIVLELFQGLRQPDGGNRLALFETPPFRG